MLLFDEIERTDLDSALYAEPEYHYWNRSGRPEAAAIRKNLNNWFAAYPDDEKDELKARIQSGDDNQFHSVMFELYLYSLLRALGCTIEIHPDLTADNITKKPDFLVRSPNGDKFYLEARVASDMSTEEVGKQARMNQIYDAINKLSSPNFFIGMNLEGAPSTSPSGKKIRAFLNKHLSNLNPDEVIEKYNYGGLGSLPHWKYEHDGWVIDFFPIPKKPEARKKKGVRPIGLQFHEFKFIDSSAAIKKVIERKATKYGELEYPYIVAIYARGISVDEEDILEALFGKEQVILQMSDEGPKVEQVQRDLNGAFISPSGPKNTRVSGVLVSTRISALPSIKIQMRLYHNPWAKRPYESILKELPEAIPKDGKMHFKEGKSPDSILELEDIST